MRFIGSCDPDASARALGLLEHLRASVLCHSVLEAGDRHDGTDAVHPDLRTELEAPALASR